ncbi:reverse transcriptase domain-containing protein, partial [Thiolapillus sp.]|uniref:reverse transcriptase domain-containing protein n=1 Tax=Thiolapillus sp. TaxID=2017437 RepID=UPI003AF68867
MPQGSVLGPILFILYTKPLSDLIQCHSIESQSFADDTQLQVSVPPSNIQSAISSLETCLSDIQTWMLENKLKLNNDKTEALLLRSSSKSFSVGKPTTISVCGCEISFSSSARNLGFYIRDDMSVELHIKNVCRSAYSELRRISTIRHLLSVDSTKTLVSAFVLSRLDYCNSLLSGCPKHLEKLQKVQNSAARLVLKAQKRDHVLP